MIGGLVSSTIPNLVNGVSQQPFALRLASQSEEQINGYSSVVEGLRKRPPTRYSAKFMNTPLSGAFIHTINRDTTERYNVIITSGDLRVFRLDGTEVPVSFPNTKNYLVSTDPSTRFAAVTVADYTFIVNKDVTVLTNSVDLVSSRPYEAIFWVRQGAYSCHYQITVAGTTVSHTTPDAVNPASALSIDTAVIAAQLQTALTASGLPAAGYTISSFGSAIYVSHAAHDFFAFASDGIGDSGLKMIKNTVQRFSDLPARGVPGFRVRIGGTNDSAFSNYYVEFEDDPGNPYGGVWKEAAKGGEIRSLYNLTMPFMLVRNSDGTFTFKAGDWAKRLVGDLTSIPMPSFVDRKINDVFFHRNRLGFLADENLILSRGGGFFNFFKESAITTLDTDPIDVAASHVKVSILRHAIPFNENLMLFSDQTQFILSAAADILTPRTANLVQATEYECSLKAKPVGSGQHVYFAVQRGKFTTIREYFVDGITKINTAASVTDHCPRYIPSNVVKLVGSSNEEVIVALSADKRNSLYVYRYYWAQQQKMQSAWFRWDFPATDTILSCDFIESDLWLVVSRPEGVFLEHISLEPGRADNNAAFEVLLDRRLSESQMIVTYDSVTDTTSILRPWPLEAGETYKLVSWYGDASFLPGQDIPWTLVGTSLVVKGHLTKFFFGRAYTFRYWFSPMVIREMAAGGTGLQPVGSGRLQLRRMVLTYNKTGYFRVEVTPFNRSTYRYVFSGRVLGSAHDVLGDISIEEGTFQFPVSAKNTEVKIEIVSDSFLPCGFLSAEWEGFFAIRSKRV